MNDENTERLIDSLESIEKSLKELVEISKPKQEIVTVEKEVKIFPERFEKLVKFKDFITREIWPELPEELQKKILKCDVESAREATKKIKERLAKEKEEKQCSD